MGEPAKIWKELEFVTESCAQCGTIFGLSAHFDKARRADHKGFWCPNGHSLAFNGESGEERLTRELAAAKRDADWQRQLREKAEKKHKREVRKLHVRVGNGVCPCCKRTFGDLARHMDAKHPDFKEAASA